MPETLGEDTNPVNQIIEINSNFLENWLTLRKQYAKEILTQGQSHNGNYIHEEPDIIYDQSGNTIPYHQLSPYEQAETKPYIIQSEGYID